ncbi:hypothetical protein Q428_02685 [Fervidicella metallireducens AeB]|uniref:Spore germination protein n=1 Tax=Fervidicella metallireducens AeB TaxID=1403537 RepID=A0A017RYB8_9CLOT|nr:Ger(x)C family spore germination protein [Fervidicella metallireducens]EYE89409.1 hypothetical protein Q428_02685 [Fervidicella metallireducens AeB]
MRFLKLIIIIILVSFQTGCYNKTPIERTSVLSGVGHDIVGEKKLSTTYEYLVFSNQNKITKAVITTTGETMFDVFNDSLLETKKTLLPGTLRLLIISEDRAKIGIQDIIDVFLRDQNNNLNTTVVICKGKAEEILKLQSVESTTMAKEIEDLIKSSYESNFTQRDTDIKDLFNMRYQAGRTIMLPYVEKYKDTVRLCSIAVFKEDKMIFKIPREDLKFVNMLRNNNSSGYLTFNSGGLLNSLSLSCVSKRKVTFEMQGDKLIYNIKLNLKTLVKEDTLKNFQKLDRNNIENLRKTVSSEEKTKLEEIIAKYQNNLDVDVFDIQKYALAKLGKDKEEFVKENFRNSKINIDVDIKIDSTGRLYK